MRKRFLLIGAVLSVAMIAGTSCKKADEQALGDIEGTYLGAFSESSIVKSAIIDDGVTHGTAEVVINEENQIQVHCFGDKIDTTFILDYYEHNDSVMVCLTDYDFVLEYGHSLGEDHMSGSMLGDMHSGETQWMHHMDDEHQEGDEHFGGFNLRDETFAYSFRMMENSTAYYLRFHGTKE